MTMSGMEGMGGMGGMDTGTEGPFRPTNERLAHVLWYMIAGSIGLFTFIRMLNMLQSHWTLQQKLRVPDCVASRPRGQFSQAWASVTAVAREVTYSQPLYFTGQISKYFTPLPLGCWILLIFYWGVILCLIWSNTILQPDSPMYAYKWEIVGFRAAWISVAQIPFVYLLSCKFSLITLLTGISYERFNWLHRWAARTVFCSVIIHWSFFFREWWLADFVALEINMMPMVKYGFGAWATIGWMVLSGFGIFRNLSYEFFVVQHLLSAGVLLWLIHSHVPSYAAYNVYLAVAFLAFDRAAWMACILVRNILKSSKHLDTEVGYKAQLEDLPGDMFRITIGHIKFDWKAGQHVYISIPRLRPFEFHPFTIANASQSRYQNAQHREITILAKARSGFTRSLHRASSRCASDNRLYRVFLTGPWGSPPALFHFESVVFMACSSGASFVIPLLQDLLVKSHCARNIALHWIVRSEDHFSWFEREIVSLLTIMQQGVTRFTVTIHVTKPTSKCFSSRNWNVQGHCSVGYSTDDTSSSSSAVSLVKESELLTTRTSKEGGGSILSWQCSGRPSIESIIRPPVESAHGETAVVACGGVSFTAQTRAFVTSLSDERAVHKGTGAQGIFLFCESHGW